MFVHSNHRLANASYSQTCLILYLHIQIYHHYASYICKIYTIVLPRISETTELLYLKVLQSANFTEEMLLRIISVCSNSSLIFLLSCLISIRAFISFVLFTASNDINSIACKISCCFKSISDISLVSALQSNRSALTQLLKFSLTVVSITLFVNLDILTPSLIIILSATRVALGTHTIS